MKKNSLTSEESFAMLAAIENEKCPNGISSYCKWQKERDQRRLQAIKNLVPRVGLGCTICYYSDKRAATVTEIISPCKIAVRFNETKCKDYYNSSYEFLDELEGESKIFTKRRNGFWVAEGQAYKDGVLLMLHYQHHFIDPSF